MTTHDAKLVIDRATKYYETGTGRVHALDNVSLTVKDHEFVSLVGPSGLASAHADILRVHMDPTYVCRATPSQRPKVALLSGGGSGHEPLHVGFVGQGMLDAACPGQIFTSPTPDQMIAAANAIDTGKGVLLIVKNYAGDLMNFEMATEMLEVENETVLVNDDVAVDNSTHTTGRRGVAGTLVVEKMVGAAAEAGADLRQCKELGDRVNKATASMGVAFTSCTVPAAGRATFDIGTDDVGADRKLSQFCR